MPAGKIAPLSMTPVEGLPDAAPTNGRGAPARWPGIFKNLTEDFAPGVWVKIRDYTPPGQAQTTRNRLFKRTAEGEFPGVVVSEDGELLFCNDGQVAIYVDARQIETDGVRSSVMHMAWQPVIPAEDETSAEGE